MKYLGVIGAVGLGICVSAGAALAVPFGTVHERVLVGESGVPGADGQFMLLCAETDRTTVLDMTLSETVTGHVLAVGSCAAADVLPLSAVEFAQLDSDGLIPQPEPEPPVQIVSASLETLGLLPLAALLLGFSALAFGKPGRRRARA